MNLSFVGGQHSESHLNHIWRDTSLPVNIQVDFVDFVHTFLRTSSMCVVVNSNDSVLFVHIFVLVTIYLYDQISCFLCYYTNVGWDCGSPTSEWNNNNIVIEEKASKEGTYESQITFIHRISQASKLKQVIQCVYDDWSWVNLRKSVVCNVLKWKLTHWFG